MKLLAGLVGMIFFGGCFHFQVFREKFDSPIYLEEKQESRDVRIKNVEFSERQQEE